MRLWLVHELLKIQEFLENNIKAMAMRAEIEIEVCMPGYVLSILDYHAARYVKTKYELGIRIYSELNRKPVYPPLFVFDGS
jgi:hypothetical protein